MICLRQEALRARILLKQPVHPDHFEKEVAELWEGHSF